MRPSAETTPAVTVESKPSGLPIATAIWPRLQRRCCRRALAAGRPAPCAFKSARSVSGSAPSSLGRHPSPVGKGHFERRRAVDDVVVGDDQPVGRDRHARTHAAAFGDDGADGRADAVGDRGDRARIGVEQRRRRRVADWRRRAKGPWQSSEAGSRLEICATGPRRTCPSGQRCCRRSHRLEMPRSSEDGARRRRGQDKWHFRSTPCAPGFPRSASPTAAGGASISTIRPARRCRGRLPRRWRSACSRPTPISAASSPRRSPRRTWSTRRIARWRISWAPRRRTR